MHKNNIIFSNYEKNPTWMNTNQFTFLIFKKDIIDLTYLINWMDIQGVKIQHEFLFVPIFPNKTLLYMHV